MNRPTPGAILATILATSGALAAVAHGQTRAQAPRANAGEILSQSMQQADNNVQGQTGRASVGAVVGSRGGRVIVDRRGQRVDRRFRHDPLHRHHHAHHGRSIGVISSGVGLSVGHSVVGGYPLGYSSYGYTTGRAYDTPTVIIIESQGPAVSTNEIDGPTRVEPVEPPTTTEVALAAMARGDHKDAITRWRERLAEAPDDASAVRALGLTMTLNGDLETGLAMIAHAYQMSPDLVHQRIEPWSVGGDRNLRQALRRVVVYANSRKTESAWLTVAMLMQAEERDDHAARMVERAREAGLSDELADKFKAALGA